MNKPVKPKQLDLVGGDQGLPKDSFVVTDPPFVEQLEPTPTQKGKMLIAGVEDFDAQVKPETAEEAVDNFLAKDLTASARRSGFVFNEPDKDDFDWNTDDSIILTEQRATAAYRNKVGELVIRQRAGWCDDSDTFVYITPDNEVTFLEALAKRSRE
jgi:hypothetical protein